ncbi:hypothetical protein BP5796_12534 [Coleophoma crateriformis]|uniref:Prion-inhibition and propagation HeLo domain-containing protein n=1 Tax=Coleophoma crateriformis TaxID=565419 RepID=A0A3D8Q7E0_9HELO|nr:hypothetical protein BP5796_12534 [Coleophoma crateriformis]
MAEIFGTVASALSIAALFNNCVDCFEYIQLGRHFGRDYERCQLKLDTAKIRMSRWGQAVGINEDPRFTIDTPADKESQHIRAILEEIDQLYRTVQKSSARYEIDATQKDLMHFEAKELQPVARRLHSRLGVIATRRQKQTSLLKKATWALYDGKNLDKLVEQIGGFVDDLEKLLPVEDTRRRLVEMEIEEVDDEQSLTALQTAAASTDQLLSEAVTKKLEGIAGTNYAKDIRGEENAQVRVGNEWSEIASTRGVNIADQTSNRADFIAAKGTSAVQIGNSFGGRSVFDKS